MAKTLSGLFVGAAALLAAAPALAQTTLGATTLDQGLFGRTRNTSVAQRYRPGYDAVPMHLGGFDVSPALGLGVEENDNIYATSTLAKSDTIFTVEPRLDVASTWSRNGLAGYATVPSREYARFSAESSTDYEVAGQGWLDVGHGEIRVGGDTGLETQARTAIGAIASSAHPIRFQVTDGFISGIEQFNRLRLTGRFELGNFDYHNNTTPGGAFLLQDTLDRNDYTYTGKAEYAVSPDTSVYLTAVYNDHRFRLAPLPGTIDRNSHGERVAVGASFDLTQLVRGDIQIGYLNQDFDQAGLKPAAGLMALGTFEWFPTTLTTVTLTGSRQIDDALNSNASAYLAATVSAQVDHELLRNVILTGRVTYADDQYLGFNRDDHQTVGYLGARYLMNHRVAWTLGYTYLQQTSTGTLLGAGYSVNRVSLAASLRF